MSGLTVIGLAGHAGSGKDTVADYLVEHHNFKRVAFADALKQLAVKINPLVPVEGVELNGQEVEILPMAWLVEAVGWDEAKGQAGVREALQDIGQAVREVIGSHAWTSIVEDIIEDDEGRTRFVISDVRYPNEADVVRQYRNSELWHVKRPGHGPINGHESELIEFSVDLTIDNSGSIEDLHREIDRQIGAML